MNPSPKASAVRCRQIGAADLEGIADLLTCGFVIRSRAWWMRGLQRQAEREVPEGYPRYGYMLEVAGRPVGVLLLIFSQKEFDGEAAICCNVSSWYIEPRYRSHAALLSAVAHKHRHVTYVNVTPNPATWPIIETQHFRRYCRGTFFALPWLSSAERGGTIELITACSSSPADISADEFELLVRHARYGCMSLICRAPTRSPLIFVLTAFWLWHHHIPLPAMQLAYCRELKDFVTVAGAIGRVLLKRGRPFVTIDANGPIPGLVGRYTESRGHRYFRGPHPPRLVDLTDTELVLYGF